MNYIKISNSKVNKDLYNFVNNEVIPGTDIDPNDFWQKSKNLVMFIANIKHEWNNAS